jgi:hypothetical protein
MLVMVLIAVSHAEAALLFPKLALIPMSLGIPIITYLASEFCRKT